MRPQHLSVTACIMYVCAIVSTPQILCGGIVASACDEKHSPSDFLSQNHAVFERVSVRDNSFSGDGNRPWQLILMTNALACATDVQSIDDADSESRLSLIKWTLSLSAVQSDTNALEYCTRIISGLETVSTNSYYSELLAANEADKRTLGKSPRRPGTFSRGRNFGPSRIAFEKKWRPIMDRNRLVVSLRKKALDAVRLALDRHRNETPSFARTNVSSFAESDFGQVEDALREIMKLDSLVSSTNSLLAIADYLSEGETIPIDSYQTDLIAALKVDTFAELGDTNHVVRAGVGHLGPKALACRQQYAYRTAYNSRLQDFRRSTLKQVYRTLSSPRWSSVPLPERNALWTEFKRRARSTQDETVGIEAL